MMRATSLLVLAAGTEAVTCNSGAKVENLGSGCVGSNSDTWVQEVCTTASTECYTYEVSHVSAYCNVASVVGGCAVPGTVDCATLSSEWSSALTFSCTECSSDECNAMSTATPAPTSAPTSAPNSATTTANEVSWEYRQIKTAGQCCRGDAIYNSVNYYTDYPAGCEELCDANPDCLYYDHSTSWGKCSLCADCDDEGSEDANYAKYTAWGKGPDPTPSPTPEGGVPTFDQIDEDGDGVITREEWDAYEAALPADEEVSAAWSRVGGTSVVAIAFFIAA